jgi:adenylate cyclase class 2
MYEVELKVRAAHEAVRPRLADIGADPRDRVAQADVYYDAPHRDFADTDEALRVRTEESDGETTTKLTYKGPLVDDHSKTRVEAETAVDDPDAARDLLAGLGFEPAATVRKERAVFEHGEYTVTLDSVDGLGEFVEVETESDDAGLESAREGARDLLERLDLDPAEQIRSSYLGLLLADDGARASADCDAQE